MGTRRKVGKKNVVRSRITPALINGSRVNIADNSGGKIAMIIGVDHYKGRLRRLPTASVGDICTCTVKKGKAELKGEVLKCVIVRQRQIYRRIDGTRLCFEDNAAVLITREGDPKGTEIRGPIAREAAEMYPRLASISSLII